MTRGRWALLVVWALFVAAMVRDGQLHPAPPSEDYGHNAPGHLQIALTASVLELVIGLWLLGSARAERPWMRLAMGGTILLSLSVVWMLGSMHTGGIMLLHLLWVFLLSAMWWGLVVVQLRTPDPDQRQIPD